MSNEVTAIDIQTATVIASIGGLVHPYGIAVAPDGKTVWVTDSGENTVSVLDAQTLEPVGAPIPVGEEPVTIAFTPDGKTAFVADYQGEEVSVIDTASRVVTSLPAGEDPWGLGVTPDGSKLYVSNYGEGTVEVIATATGAVIDEFEVGSDPYEFGMSPNGKVVYLAQYGSENVLAIDTTTDKVIGAPIELPGEGSWQVVVAPDQSPTASFTASSATAGAPVTFDGSSSSDPDGSIAFWGWAFGDGGSGSGKTITHTYATSGIFSAQLSVVDNEGCGGAQVFTGRTALCSGGASPVAHPVTVTPAVTPPVVVPPRPSNRLRFGRLVHNLHNGTVRLQVRLPAPGSVLLTGPKVHLVRKKIGAPGSLWLTIHARVKLNKQLKTKLRAKVGFKVTFSPTGGTPASTARSVVLRRAPKKN